MNKKSRPASRPASRPRPVSRPVSGPRNISPMDLLTYTFPLTAIASITHRIAGVFLYFSLGLALYVLHYSLKSEEHFDNLAEFFASLSGMFLTWMILSGLAYHFVAGIKHLIMDLGIGESLEGGALLAKFTVSAAAVLIVLAGYWVFL